LPPLRERVEDIPLLARHLAARFGAPRMSDDEVFTSEALEALMEHTWPGNVRELANVIEHAMILCDALPIRPEHLPQRFFTRQPATVPFQPANTLNLRDLEMQAIHEALTRHSGNKPKAAEELGISLKTLYNKLNQTAGLSKTA
jgi:DNA-binding NtrC family response regulator